VDICQVCFLDSSFFDSNTPTPIAKNTINGRNLYGWFVCGVNPVSIGDINSIPDMNTIIDSPCFIPFLDTMNNPTISGIVNSITSPSNLNWYANDVNPI